MRMKKAGSKIKAFIYLFIQTPDINPEQHYKLLKPHQVVNFNTLTQYTHN